MQQTADRCRPAHGVFALAAILLYVLNPSGTASPEPRPRIFGFSLFRMPSASMTPTLQPGDLLVVSPYPYRRHKPSVGDLAVFYVGDNGPPYVKRVIARGGDQVRIESGVAIVNGVALEETYMCWTYCEGHKEQQHMKNYSR